MNNAKAISEFWNAFQKHADALSRITSADNPLYDKLLKQLQRIDAHLYFEFSTNTGQCELLITAEGRQSLFACVDAIVSVAPHIEGWTVFALKPKLGFPDTVTWEGYKVTVADAVFDPLDNEDGDLGLRLLVPGLNAEDIDDAHNGLLRAIDHGLGEREFAEAVRYTEVVALEGSASDYIPLTGLEKFIQWRKKKRGGN